MSNDAELKRFKTELLNCWRIAEELGQPTPKYLQVHELVSLEMKFRAEFPLAMKVANLAADWIKTANPYLIDQAVILCSDAGVVPSDALWVEVANVARKRFAGEVIGGTPDRIKKDDAMAQAFTIMLNLRDSGATMAIAASKAARWLSENAPDQSIKASTLERRYSKTWLAKAKPGGPTREEEMIARWKESKTQEVKDTWAALLKALPDADDELKGDRR